MSGVYSISSVNGDVTNGTAYFDNTVLYPNQFMTLNQQHYTKHYFIGSERIGTTIGGGNDGHWLITPMFNNLNQAEQHLRYTLSDGSTYDHSYYAYYHNLNDNNHTINTNYTGSVNSGSNTFALYQYNDKEQHLGYLTFNFSGMFVDAMQEYCFNNRTDMPYYYHSDHLGSAAWITDAKGSPVQYLMYAPYGEQLLNQQSTTTYNERFTFTGKERDIETGYVHFDARNLFEVASIWLSPDPLLDKYIYNSPYVYCDGNPIKFIDPSGMDWIENNETGEITWDKNITSSEQTPDGYTYRGVAYARTSYYPTIQQKIVELYDENGHENYYMSNEYGMYRFPEEGRGFSRYTTAHNNEEYMVGNYYYQGDNYISAEAFVNFYNAIQEFYNQNNITIYYGDISAYNPSINLGHMTHMSGNSIDIHYIGNNGVELIGNDAYSRANVALMNAFFRCVQSYGFIKNYSYGNRFLHSGNPNQKVHKHHFHIGL